MITEATTKLDLPASHIFYAPSTVTIMFPEMPRTLGRVDESWDVLLTRKRPWVRGHAFIGVDRGNIVEAHLEVIAKGGDRVFLTSIHKEVEGNYDAWISKPIEKEFRQFRVNLLAYSTLQSQVKPVKAHFELVLEAV